MTGKSSPRSFIVAFIGLTASALITIALFNIIVDPFWRFDVVHIAGFNEQKNQFPANERLGKAGVLCRLQPKTIVLGSSRVEVGIDPTSPAFRALPGPVYNAGLAGAGFREVDVTMRHAIHASPQLKHIFVGLDFLMFNANREATVFDTEVHNFDENRLLLSSSDSCFRSLLHDLDAFLGPKALVSSIATISDQMTEPTVANASTREFSLWTSNFDRNGFRNNFYLLDKLLVPIGGYRGLFAKSQEAYYLRRVWRPPPKQRYCFAGEKQSNTMTTFRRMLDFARASGIDLRFFINPIHARLLLAVRYGGLWPQYEEWKQGLVRALADEAKASGKPAFPLWDFSGFNSVTNEHVPDGKDFSTIMRGYWEPSHYKAALGNLLLARMLGYTDNGNPVPRDFGHLLTAENINSWTLETREKMRAYMIEEPEEDALIKSVADEVLLGSEGSNCGYDVDALREASNARSRGDKAASEAALMRAIDIHESDRRRYASMDAPYREDGFERMLALFKSGNEIMPLLRDWIAYQERAMKRLQEGDYAGAVEDFSDAIRLGPTNTALYYLRGTTRLRTGDRNGAAKDFEAGLKLEPSNPTLKSLLIQARSAESTNTTAISQPVNPKLAIELQQAADAKRNAGDFAGAIVQYGRAIEVSPPNTALFYLRGTTRLQIGDRVGAAADFEEGLELDPNNATLKGLLGQARSVPAIPSDAQSKNPGQAIQLQGSAEAKLKAGDLSGAIDDYGRAIEVSPPNTALFYLRGTTRLQIGDRAGAAADFEAGLKLDPENMTLRSLLSQAR